MNNKKSSRRQSPGEAKKFYQKSICRCVSALLFVWIVIGLAIPHCVFADSWRTISRIVREVGEVSDDLPLRRIDEVTAGAKRSRLAEETIERKLGKVSLDTADEARHLDRIWRELVRPGRDYILKEVKALPIPEQRLACALSIGAHQLKQSIPDIATRGTLMRNGGPETLLAIARYPDLAEDALRFDMAVKNRRLLSPASGRSIETADFGRFFESTGDRGYYFWNKYVRPNWKLWLGGSALAAVMLAPDEYLDEVGNFTERGLAKIARFGSKTLFDAVSGAARGTIEGTGTGIKEVVETTWGSFVATFLTSFSGIVALFCLVAVVTVLVKPWRCWIYKTVTRIYTSLLGRKARRS